MRGLRATPFVPGLLAIAAMAAPARASFHLMQVEQVIGGVNGDVTAQAVQLRMRNAFQNVVSQGRLIARDAAGNNPILLLNIASNVANTASGTRILIASSNFARYTSAAITPDFTMAALIPASYLAAGSLTFESDTGAYPAVSVLWRVSWGGAAFTGINTGALTNDADGNFGPPFGVALSSTSLQALKFNNAATAPSTNNAADYSVTVGAATFANSSGVSVTVANPICIGPSCRGDASNDNRVDGDDVALFVKSFLGGNARTIATVCSDMDASGTFTAADLPLFVQKVLGVGDPLPACP